MNDSPDIDLVTLEQRARPARRIVRRAVTVALLVIVVAAIILTWMRWGSVRSYLAQQLREPYTWPDKSDHGLRQVLLRTRAHALARGDLPSAAVINGSLAQEALLRVGRVHDAWMLRRHPRTKLFPESPSEREWNYRNTAADFFGFQLHATLRVRPASLPSIRETLNAERALAPAGALCQPVDFATGQAIPVDDVERMFGSSEYVKDGLLSVYERHGQEHGGPRMFEVLDSIIANAGHNSKFGLLPGGGTELNGNVLQACSRLSFAADTHPRRVAYAEMAARVADAVTQQMLPACNGLPVRTFNYENNRAVETHIKLRDHGNEVVPGLAEAYAMAVTRRTEDPVWSARADRWAEPIATMLETLLSKGCNADGLPLSAIDTATFEITDHRPCDNWGYLLNGVLLFTQAARQHGQLPTERLDALEAGADRVIDAVTKLYGAPWEGEAMDGYCDTLESALYIAHYRPQRADALLPWVDDQIGLLFSRQRPDGFVSDSYLDGNFIRTALMYADLRAGGWRVEPFRSDVCVGYAHGGDGQAALTITCDAPYRGRLLRDSSRHRQIMRLPWDWPRVNSWPQWCRLETMELVAVEGLSGTVTIDQLRDGLPLDLPAYGLAVLRFQERVQP